MPANFKNLMSALGRKQTYVDCHGSHGFGLPEGTGEFFDISGFMMNQAGWFVMTGGKEIRDDACLEDASCAFFPERVRGNPLAEEEEEDAPE